MSEIKTGNYLNNVGGVGNSAQKSLEQAYDASRETGFKELLDAAVASGDDEKLKEAAREFEAYFLGVMLKQMRKTVPDGGLIEKSETRKHFEAMLDDEYTRSMSQGEGIGIANAIYEALKRAYE